MIEDLILQHDKRGISALRPYLPSNFCEQAAQLVLSNPGIAFIVTGFYIIDAEAPETDGPPGALAIGNALTNLDYPVYYVTDRFTESLMHNLTGTKDRVITFPLEDDAASQHYARELLRRYQPSLLISIERCGLTRDGTYLNMRGVDISRYNARIDYLFHHHQKTIGIGDGGNEIGMGNLAEVIPTAHPQLPRNPCVTRVTCPVIASVSNWGGYGLVAALSKLVRRHLLPSVEEERGLIERAVALGAVDGIKKKQVPGVDDFPLEDYSQVLRELHLLLANEGVHGSHG
mgnify:CR=1 FL=1